MSLKSKDHQANILVALAVLKCFSEQSTYLTGELRHESAHWLKTTVRAADNFISEIEKSLDDHNKETLEIAVVEFNNGLIGFKQGLLENI